MAEDLKQYYIRWAKQHRAYENKCKPIFYNAIKAQVEPVLQQIANGSTDESLVHLVHSGPIQNAYRICYELVGGKAALREYQWLKRQEPTKADPNIIVQFLSQRWTRFMTNYALTELAEMVQNVTDETKEQIRFALALASEQGLIGRQAAKLVYDHTLGKIGRRRALVIARTESTRAANEGKRQGAEDWAQEVGTTLYKGWIARLDGHERDSHRNASLEKPIPSDGKFKVGDSKMDQPGDPTAPAKETVLCRCTQIFMSERKFRRDYAA